MPVFSKLIGVLSCVCDQDAAFSARFSSNGRWVASVSLDGTTCVWNITDRKLHRIANHLGEKHALGALSACADSVCVYQGACLDLHWLSDDVFAFCGAEHIIRVMHRDDVKPFATLQSVRPLLLSYKPNTQ